MVQDITIQELQQIGFEIRQNYQNYVSLVRDDILLDAFADGKTIISKFSNGGVEKSGNFGYGGHSFIILGKTGFVKVSAKEAKEIQKNIIKEITTLTN
jgi:hypothetical protein